MIELSTTRVGAAQADHRIAPPRDLDTKHCVFRCAGSWFSVPATAVRELRLAPSRVSVPGAPAALAGVCHVRSEFLPVLRLNVLLGDTADGAGESQLLVLTGSSGHWALLVTEVVALESLETLADPSSPGTHRRPAAMRSAAIRGTATYGDQIVQVIDPAALYRHVQDTLNRCWNDLIPSSSRANDPIGAPQ